MAGEQVAQSLERGSIVACEETATGGAERERVNMDYQQFLERKIIVTNYEKLHLFNPNMLTLTDTDVAVLRLAIEARERAVLRMEKHAPSSHAHMLALATWNRARKTIDRMLSGKGEK